MALFITSVLVFLIPSTLGATCQYIQAQAGDGCWALANRCGITQQELENYNTESNFCNTIKADQYVCCSAGSPPNFAPQPYSNGTCYTYAVQPDDNCDDIALAHKMDKGSITIPSFNNETWGWAGCSDLQRGQLICLSQGTPPFPAPMANAICGPQVPGTLQPARMAASNWTNLNPCPLNACCDIWGQCGITADFCTPNPADTGAPGTAKTGSNGCISNCGTKVVNNANAPTDVKRIGYFEAWNFDRPCLHMDISEFQPLSVTPPIGGSPFEFKQFDYTHLHWAFANVTPTWDVDVSGAQDQFNGLLNLTGIKRILSFGGWGFSTGDYTFSVFRNGVKDGNRQVLSKNIVDFIVNNNLDGVDFDWEYPAAQDIPGIPADSLDSGKNYLEFLKLVRAQLPSSKSLSIAAPASYWYLRSFPIKEISNVVDYIVYMTYDLHGQWDYNSTFADPGCQGVACLRSQVNKTETEYALAMITKAGVEAKQVVVGLPLYGRSFEMAQAGCTGPECHFTGPTSGAEEGECTQTAGYLSNIEIYEIIAQAQTPDLYGEVNITQYYDEGDVLIYDDINWVSWLSPASYASRRDWYNSLNFGGTSDWAVDLNYTYNDNGTGLAESTGFDGSDYQPCDYSKTFSSLDDLSAAADSLPSECVAVYSLQVLIDMLDVAYQNYTDVNNGYDDLFGYYVTYIENLTPEILKENFMFNASTTGAYSTYLNVGYGMNYFDCVLGDGTQTPCSKLDNVNYEETMSYKTTALTLTDENGYQDGLAQAGLEPDWVTLGDYEYDRTPAAYGASRKFEYKFTGFPIKNDSMVVPNPKDIVTQAMPNMGGLRTSMQATLLDLMLGQWSNGSVSDATEAYSMPVFMLMQVVDNMAEAKKLGKQEKQTEEEEAKRKKDFILLIISIVLVFVPVVGEEVAAAAGLATLARTIAIAGELGNGALAIYDTVQDPKSAAVNILGMLFGVASIAKVSRDGSGLSQVAKVRQGMKSDEIASLGSIFKNNDDKLQAIMKVCKA